LARTNSPDGLIGEHDHIERMFANAADGSRAAALTIGP
jgi:hypothetical protein